MPSAPVAAFRHGTCLSIQLQIRVFGCCQLGGARGFGWSEQAGVGLPRIVLGRGRVLTLLVSGPGSKRPRPPASADSISCLSIFLKYCSTAVPNIRSEIGAPRWLLLPNARLRFFEAAACVPHKAVNGGIIRSSRVNKWGVQGMCAGWHGRERERESILITNTWKRQSTQQ